MEISDFFDKALARLKKPDKEIAKEPIMLNNWFLQQTDSVYFTDCFYLIGDLESGQNVQTGIIVHAYFDELLFIDASGDKYVGKTVHPGYLKFLQDNSSPLLEVIAKNLTDKKV